MILVDTSGVLANYNRRDQYHAAAAAVLARPDQLILSPFVLAELDYLVASRQGEHVELAVLEDVAKGAYQLAPFTAGDVAAARALILRYAGFDLGLADASILVLAERHRCFDILTLDQRHFRSVRGPEGQSFRLLPTDAG